MNKIIRYLQSYLILGLPFVITLMCWNTFYSQNKIHSSLGKTAFTLLAFNLMFWFIGVILFLILLVVMPTVRERTLTRLANLKERDEREQYITGKASRASFISTLSLLVCLLFFSMFSLHITKTPKEQVTDGHHYTVNIGMGFSLLSNSHVEKTPKNNEIFASENFSLSSSSIILILLCWQLISFNLAARKEQIHE